MTLDDLAAKAEQLPDFNGYMISRHKTFAGAYITIGTEHYQAYGDTTAEAFAECLTLAKDALTNGKEATE